MSDTKRVCSECGQELPKVKCERCGDTGRYGQKTEGDHYSFRHDR